MRAMLAAFLFITFAAAPVTSSAQVSLGIGIGVNIAPPAIPIYTQPLCPGPNFIWQPGYWGWGPGGYYWVPGTWVLAPSPGLLWTPGYWGWVNNVYYWHHGYWGPTVGFYGGINYGFGYFGSGFVGGYWRGGNFFYNTAIMNVNRTVVRNTYIDKTVINKNYYTHTRTSYNGGAHGVQTHPTSGQLTGRTYGREMTPQQRYHEETAAQDHNHLATVNHGTPHTTAIQHPYSSNNRPPNFTPVTSADRQAAQQHVAVPMGGHKPPNTSGQRPPR
jgi:WXXGXW repeat (2 copies)